MLLKIVGRGTKFSDTAVCNLNEIATINVFGILQGFVSLILHTSVLLRDKWGHDGWRVDRNDESGGIWEKSVMSHVSIPEFYGRIFNGLTAMFLKVSSLYAHSKTCKSCPYTSLNRPLGLLDAECFRISRRSAHEGEKIFSPTPWPPLSSKKYFWHSFMLESESSSVP